MVVSSYTITIAADDSARATTTLRVEVTDAAARITELLVRAGDGDGLSAGQLPAVDLDLLVRAVAPATRGPAAIAPPPAATADAAVEDGVGSGQPVTDHFGDPSMSDAASPSDSEASPAVVEAPEPTLEAPAAARVPRQPRASGAKKTTAKKAARSANGAAATRQPTKRAAKKTKAVSAAAKPARTPGQTRGGLTGEQGRRYRRSPEDIDTVFQQVGTVTGVADHYTVPRHTAQSWVNTLRRKQASTTA
jgi:hypothetical protein